MDAKKIENTVDFRDKEQADKLSAMIKDSVIVAELPECFVLCNPKTQFTHVIHTTAGQVKFDNDELYRNTLNECVKTMVSAFLMLWKKE